MRTAYLKLFTINNDAISTSKCHHDITLTTVKTNKQSNCYNYHYNFIIIIIIIIIIIFINPRKNEGGKKIKKSRKRFEVEN